MRAIAALVTAVCLGGCAGTPTLPVVDERARRPLLQHGGLELQGCRSDLASARLDAAESQDLAQRNDAALRQLASRCSKPAEAAFEAKASAASNASVGADVVYVILYARGQWRAALTSKDAARLVGDARTAGWIEIRGRTDASNDVQADGILAWRRAAEVRSLLIAQGIDAERIRVSWEGQGERIASNDEAQRALCRRAEVQVFRKRPERIVLRAGN
jgi:OmpA family protein